ncbi:atypical membrane-integrating protein (Mistic protein) [Rossellomorea aquimaris]|uniref:atypical membrane-integrating protein (Mistic protein) n=1 Tax=Rossellomorea aquimaris TaxID=189382 RepID=UPI001CD2DE0C|nr:atypical membrane-integrating protein (Mistic protein) [Rossellomorea aquimaris]MCA1055691.1 atypical membrane-integrating protein (Mistic protein) [Rossellomorea aquimaris]
MRAKSDENEKYSEAIDRMQEGLEAMIELYNDMEEETPFVDLEEGVLKDLEKAKQIYGEEYVSQKVNGILKEVLSWLDLEGDKKQ